MTVEDRNPRQRSFEEYVTARWAALYRTAHLLTGDRFAAEDLLQTTLIKVHAQWPKVHSADSPDAYVRKMLLNEMLSERRKIGRRALKAHLVPVPSSPADPAVDSSTRLDLWALVQVLPPRQRAVLVLRYYEDLSESEIADVLGISNGTVKSQASLALRTLRAHQTRNSTEEVS